MKGEIKKEIEVTLKLTEKEFNSIVASYGKVNYFNAKNLADELSLEMLNDREHQNLYEELHRMAMRLRG